MSAEPGRYLVLENGKVRQKNYRLIDIDSSIPGDMALQEKIDSFLETIDRDVLRKVNLTSKKVIAQSAFDLTIKEEESNLGNLIADAIRWWVNKHDSDPRNPRTRVGVAIESNGLIRDNALRGKTGALAWIRKGVSTEYHYGDAPPSDTVTLQWEPWLRVGDGKDRELASARSAAMKRQRNGK